MRELLAVQQPSVPWGRLCSTSRKAAVWLYIITLAWAPFPLGGAIAWAAGAQEILIALCWILWVISTTGRKESVQSRGQVPIVPLSLALLALVWAAIQICPLVPADWAHPVWAMASETLGKPVSGVISLNPWRTQAEIVKLGSYVMACWLAYRMASRPEVAASLLRAVAAIGGAYVLYAFVLVLSDRQQVNLFYSVPYHSPYISGPFMLHNSFATWCGLSMLAAVALLFAGGSGRIVSGRGPRRLVSSLLQYCFGSGAAMLIAALLSFAGVIASASRGGFAAVMSGMVALGLASLLIPRRGKSRVWAGVGALAVVLPLALMVLVNGNTLAYRIDLLLDAGLPDNIRLALWDAALRMIVDAPLLGLGLGTFQDAYPLYATQVLPFVMDKAHCDYLEFVAGIGLPAALAWFAAIAWLAVGCLRGVRVRHRNRQYCLVAFAATVLVAVHSSADFSLQLPAISLLYATLLGIGVAQSQPSRNQYQ